MSPEEVSELATYLGLVGSFFLAMPSLILLVKRRDYQRFLDTYKDMNPQKREADILWKAGKDNMLLSLIAWSKIDAWFLLIGAILLFLSFLIELGI